MRARVGRRGASPCCWLVIALPALGAAILLVGGPLGQGTPRQARPSDRGRACPVAVVRGQPGHVHHLLGRDSDDRQVGQHLFTWFEAGGLQVGVRPALRPAVGAVPAADHRCRVADPHLLDRLHGARPAAAALLRLPQPLRRGDARRWCSSANYLGLFLGWEGVGLASYLLIGFWQYKHSAAAAAKKAFIVNRVGDIGLSLGVAPLLHDLRHHRLHHDQREPRPTRPRRTMTALGLLLLLAACGKSAQVPLQSWLLDAMEGPTPGVGPDPRRDDGHGRRLPDRPLQLHLRLRAARPHRGGHRRDGHAAVRRDHRVREGRHQEGAGRLDDEPDRLHDARRRASASRATRSRSSTCSPTASSRPTCSSAPAR